MRPYHYRLEGHTPVPCSSIDEWVKSHSVTHVARTEIGEVWVSTVFLGLDHNFFDDGPPILFETMAFVGEDCSDAFDLCRRYCTWDEAEAGHAEVVAEIRALVDQSSLSAADALAAFKGAS